MTRDEAIEELMEVKNPKNGKTYYSYSSGYIRDYGDRLVLMYGMQEIRVVSYES